MARTMNQIQRMGKCVRMCPLHLTRPAVSAPLSQKVALREQSVPLFICPLHTALFFFYVLFHECVKSKQRQQERSG